MPKRLHIPTLLHYKHKDLSKSEIRTVVKTILSFQKQKLSKSQVFKISIPHLGTIKSHGKKKIKTAKRKLWDRKRKALKQKELELSKDHLLF